jgi:putative glycosyltransferase (TIGR04372 family)
MTFKNFSPIDKIVSWVNKNTPIFIMTTSQTEVGNTAEEIHAGHLYAIREKKKILVLRIYQIRKFPRICNKELFSVTSPATFGRLTSFLQFCGNVFLTIAYGHIPVTFKYLLVNAYNYVRSPTTFKLQKRWSFYDTVFLGIDHLWSPSPEAVFSRSISNSINWNKEYVAPSPLSLDERKSLRAKKQLKEFGIASQDWFVCLHVREAGYYGDIHSPRNSSISNYREGIKAIVDAGGWVIRLGDKSMSPLPKMDKVIDYPFTKYKSEFMDLYLIKNCRFYFGQNSGPFDIAKLFHTNLIIVNATELMMSVPPKRNQFAIPKHFFSKKLNRYLSIKELISGDGSTYDFSGVNSDDYIFKENSPDEIKAVVLESLAATEEDKYSLAQLEFNKLRIKNIYDVLERKNPIFSGKKRWPYTAEGWDNIIRFRLSSHTETHGTIGKRFLEKNWDRNHLNTPSGIKLT